MRDNPRNYVVIDFETANADPASICQVGLVAVKRGTVAAARSFLINPRCDFAERNVSIHGITEAMVARAGTFPQLIERLGALLEPFPLFHHGSFDRAAFGRACARHAIARPAFKWIDTTEPVREAWPQFAQRGYNLPNLCRELGIAHRPHDALSDALALHGIIERMRTILPDPLTDWQETDTGSEGDGGEDFTPVRVLPAKIRRMDGDPHGEFAGCSLVFTGNFNTMSRSEAQLRAASIGFDTTSSVSGKTTHLCITDEQAASGKVTGKIKAARKAVAAGQQITFLSETEFLEMVREC